MARLARDALDSALLEPRNQGAGGAARFDGPHGVAVDGGGNVYVADTDNNTIQKVTAAGVVTTLAGLASISGSADGTGIAAQFGYPRGVAVDGAGNLYVADESNNTIRSGRPENVPAVMAPAGPALGFNSGHFGFLLTGPTGQLVVIETSTNLLAWLPLWTNTFDGPLNFNDAQSDLHPQRFYRARTP